MTGQEQKIVDKAIGILEYYQDQEAKKEALRLLSKGEVKIPLQRLSVWTIYAQIIRRVYDQIFNRLLPLVQKKEYPYIKAERDLCMSCLDACCDYHEGRYEIAYRNHKRDKKGKLISCEAYFVKRKQIVEEVIYEHR